MDKENVSQLVWLYVKRRPFIKESLRDHLVNYSSLARRISQELYPETNERFVSGYSEPSRRSQSRDRQNPAGSEYRNQKKFNAIKVALQRIANKLAKGEEGLEEKVIGVLRGSSLNIETKIAVVISSGELPIRSISQAKSRGNITYIVKESEADKLKNDRKVRLIQKNFNLITIISSKELEDTPGVISLLLGALASEGINVQEIISCYTDTLLVIKESDTTKAYEIINGIIS